MKNLKAFYTKCMLVIISITTVVINHSVLAQDRGRTLNFDKGSTVYSRDPSPSGSTNRPDHDKPQSTAPTANPSPSPPAPVVILPNKDAYISGPVSEITSQSLKIIRLKLLALKQLQATFGLYKFYNLFENTYNTDGLKTLQLLDAIKNWNEMAEVIITLKNMELDAVYNVAESTYIEIDREIMSSSPKGNKMQDLRNELRFWHELMVNTEVQMKRRSIKQYNDQLVISPQLITVYFQQKNFVLTTLKGVQGYSLNPTFMIDFARNNTFESVCEVRIISDANYNADPKRILDPNYTAPYSFTQSFTVEKNKYVFPDLFIPGDYFILPNDIPFRIQVYFEVRIYGRLMGKSNTLEMIVTKH